MPLPTSACCNGVELEAGRYELPNYWGSELRVDIGEGLRVIFDTSARLGALNDPGYFTTGFLIVTATRQSMLRFALEPGERTMLVLIDAPPNEFEDLAAQAEEILKL